MIVAAAGGGVTRRNRRIEVGGQPVPFGELGEEGGRRGGKYRVEEPRRARIARAVDALEEPEEDQDLLDVIEGQAVVDAKQRMRHDMHDALAAGEGAKVVEIALQALQLAMLRLGDAEDQDVEVAAVLGKGDGLFAGEKGPWQVRDVERAGDRVVIGDGHEVHAADLRQAIDLERLGEALRRADAIEVPLARPVGVPAVNVDIAARGHEGVLLSGRRRA